MLPVLNFRQISGIQIAILESNFQISSGSSCSQTIYTLTDFTAFVILFYFLACYLAAFSYIVLN